MGELVQPVVLRAIEGMEQAAQLGEMLIEPAQEGGAVVVDCLLRLGGEGREYVLPGLLVNVLVHVEASLS